jgi:RNA polymerase sigma-70 factor (ECF subfamily)
VPHENSTIVRAEYAESCPLPMVEMFEAHRAQLMAKAYHLTRSRPDAEDIVQGVWIRWAAQCRDVSAPTSWLHTVTANAAIDHLRHLGRRHEVPRVDLDQLPSSGAEPHRVVESREQIQTGVRILLESLSALERAVFVCRRVGRWSHAEIASALRRTPEAVRQADHRARVRFKQNPKRFVATDSVVRKVTRQLLVATSAGEAEWMIHIVWLDLPLAGA